MTHLPQLIQDLTLILVTAAIVSVLFRKLKLPLILGYMLAGFIVGPELHLIPTVGEVSSIRVWAELGIIFLLFSLGLEFHFKKLWNLGFTSVGAASFEVAMMFGLGYATGILLGRSHMESFFIGGLISISSTSVILKSFDELHLKSKKFTESVFGILIVEDVLAIAIMIALTTASVSRNFEGTEFLYAMSKLGFFLVLCIVLGIFLIPTLIEKIQRHLNDETLLLVSLGFCLLMVLTASKAGFSPALGAFLMGSILGETRQRFQMQKLTSSIRDLFAAVFFVSVGMLIDPKILVQSPGLILGFVTLVILGKLTFTTIGSLVFGQNFKNSFLTGLSVTQIGEFSFIIATLGLSLNVLDQSIFSLTVAVSIITTFTTPLLLRHSEKLAVKFEKSIPKKILQLSEKYDKLLLVASAQSSREKALLSYFTRTFLNIIMIIAIMLFCTQVMRPWLFENVDTLFTNSGEDMMTFVRYSIHGLTLAVCILLMGPFTWAILFSADKNQNVSQFAVQYFGQRGLRIFVGIRVLLVWILLSLLFSQFFSYKIILILNSVLLLLSRTKFFQLAQPVYERLEREFVRRFRNTGRTESIFEATLSPWQAHLSLIEVPIESQACGKSLIELNMREQFGLIITLIQRGQIEILAPGPNDRIFPMDRLYVIGTDEQVEKFTNYIEMVVVKMHAVHVDDYVLEPIVLGEMSPFIGKTIRESGLREIVLGLVVGIERDGHRHINPDSQLILATNDILWIFGNKKNLKQI